MSSIVLKIPYESQSFHAALTDATLRDRVQEWVAAVVVAAVHRHNPRGSARPLTHYLVMVEDDEVDQAQAALEMVGTFVPEEGV